MPAMWAEIQELINRFPGKVGVWLENLHSHEQYAHNPDWKVYAASTIKLPMLCYALSTGADLRQAVPVKPEAVAGGSGVLKDLSPGLALPLLDLLTLMIVVSDNTATNVVLDFFGHKEPFNAYYRAQGWRSTYSAGMLSLPDDRPDPRRAKGEASTVSAEDLGLLLKQLWTGQLLPPEATQTALSILSRQQFTFFLRYLPADLDDLEEGTAPLRLYAKSGEIRKCRHDAGILARDNAAYSLVVLTETDADPRFHPDHPAVLLIGKIASVLYQHRLG
ncbi:Beta-lactamase enzyme family protein [Calidithermus terrae]|uniref:Beta-lactamase enzyme family protein n=1 Tax=Calidithermus terrae TaxID=1408545 RepID=A0A399F5R1_9DEIN|nr:serine hydrolase [Calidithermus terrae]RIH90212.1 Beta-lactamase enzyme family protein [Calidithermus terrae]